ncbi:MAG: mannose-1-phosphate guanylyltransferase/mannose-6-phosphate isomerase [Alphaproteobacteria bacterium GM202ARS2]|nr:mannose-1-phosphate guanylyltransferase/mannose-6-phosphate isomerase [Alphaproteobacteria bacterium GM202ARS2]
MTTGTIYPVILCGGQGTRLWPLSRYNHPKQFLALYTDVALIVETARRFTSAAYAPLTFVCHQEHHGLLIATLKEHLTGARILLEPVARNTAAAIAVATLALQQALDPSDDSTLVFMPADHVFPHPAPLHDAIKKAQAIAAHDHIVTFGITPDSPQTGYGYIQKGTPVNNHPASYHIQQFHEKPSHAQADAYIASQDFFWNSGLFCARPATLVREFQQHAPDTLRHAEQSLKQATTHQNTYTLAKDPYGCISPQPFDQAVMEKTSKGVVIPLDTPWSDIGDWQSLWQMKQKDPQGNVLKGHTTASDTQNSLIYSTDNKRTVAIGIKDTVIVNSDDAVLVAKTSMTHHIKPLLDSLTDNKQSYLQAKEDHRPWGSYRIIDQGEGYLVKHITVHPNGILSLQYHHHRSEHWTVVQGVAFVTREDETFQLRANQSTYIPQKAKHRLENRSKKTLKLIEVQIGKHLREDDIVRLDDVYGRAK